MSDRRDLNEAKENGQSYPSIPFCVFLRRGSVHNTCPGPEGLMPLTAPASLGNVTTPLSEDLLTQESRPQYQTSAEVRRR